MDRLLALGLWICASNVAYAQNDTVLWYHGNGGTTNDATAFENHIVGPLMGAIDFEDDWSTLNWADYRFVLIARPTQTFDAAQIADLQAYIATGGLVVVAGDSNVAGLPQIDTINTLMADLGRSARLEDSTFVNETDPLTSLPSCMTGTVINGGPLIASSNPPSFQDMGDIDPGTASILVAYSVIVQTTLFAFELIVEEDGVLLTADYDLFSGNPCGEVSKESFWTGLWQSGCDLDGDGIDGPQCGGPDCDDSNPAIGFATDFADLDLDGFGDDTTTVCTGGIPTGGDCDDSDPDVNPSATETCDGVDNDCDGDTDGGLLATFYPDDDADGFGAEAPVEACAAPSGHVTDAGDCDDTNADVNPDGVESCPGNGIDDDCDGDIDELCSVGPPPPPPPKKCGCTSGGLEGVLIAPLLPWLMRRR